MIHETIQLASNLFVKYVREFPLRVRSPIDERSPHRELVHVRNFAQILYYKIGILRKSVGNHDKNRKIPA